MLRVHAELALVRKYMLNNMSVKVTEGHENEWHITMKDEHSKRSTVAAFHAIS